MANYQRISENPAYDNIRYLWDNCTVGFVCLCGADVVVDSQGDPHVCDCGRIYDLYACVTVRE